MFTHENEPVTCPNGHPHGPNLTVVSFARCTCPAAAVAGGHLTWRCRTCDTVQYADGHTDNGQLVGGANPPVSR